MMKNDFEIVRSEYEIKALEELENKIGISISKNEKEINNLLNKISEKIKNYYIPKLEVLLKKKITLQELKNFIELNRKFVEGEYTSFQAVTITSIYDKFFNFETKEYSKKEKSFIHGSIEQCLLFDWDLKLIWEIKDDLNDTLIKDFLKTFEKKIDIKEEKKQILNYLNLLKEKEDNRDKIWDKLFSTKKKIQDLKNKKAGNK